MSKFEDHLWHEFVREHGDALAQMRSPTATHTRRARPRLLVGTGVGLAGAGGVVALVLGATTTSPAFAVTRHHDGTVTVLIKRSSGVAGANAKLHQLGIRARVTPQVPVGCTPTLSPGRGRPAPTRWTQPIAKGRPIAKAHWTIDPRRIPAHKTLALAPPPMPRGHQRDNAESRGQTWSCGTQGPGVGAPPPAPPSGASTNTVTSGTSGNPVTSASSQTTVTSGSSQTTVTSSNS